jgi:Gram-negative bacterial TonB protein C-terminal
MSEAYKIAPLSALALLLILATSADASAQTKAPQTPKRGLVSVDSLVVDSFDSVSQWSTNPAEGVEITVHPDSGRHGLGMRLDFDFHGHRGYGIVHRKVDLDLPANYEFTFAVRGEAPTNTLEFKLVDTTGENVWWSNNRYFIFPREWRTIARKKRQICFAWGPTGDSAPKRYDLSAPGCRLGIDIHRVAAIEFAITAGSGGKGSVWIDDLSLSPLDPNSPQPEDRPTDDEAQTQTYFEFQVEKPATMLDGAPMPKYPRVLERSGIGGEVQAQFVVRNSGKADMDSFKVLKSTDELFTQAVRNWIIGITFSPAMIGGKAVNQLVQQSFQFAVPR